MRLALACLLFLAGLGCKGVSGVPCDPTHGACAGGPGVAHGGPGCLTHSDENCPLHAAGHKCSICEKKKKEEKREVPQQREAEAPQPREAVVTQDIMLIPRMVYVPYAPQVPVAPARLGTVVPGARGVETPAATKEGPAPTNREAEQPRAAEKQICEALDRCCTMMQVMDKRLCDLEGRSRATPPPVQVQPVIIQQAPPGPRCLSSLFCKPHIPCLGPSQ